MHRYWPWQCQNNEYTANTAPVKTYKHHALIAINVFSLIAKNRGGSPKDAIVCLLFIVVGRSHCSSNLCWLHVTSFAAVPTAVAIYPCLPLPQLSLPTTTDAVDARLCIPQEFPRNSLWIPGTGFWDLGNHEECGSFFEGNQYNTQCWAVTNRWMWCKGDYVFMRVYLWFHLETCACKPSTWRFKFSISLNARLAIAYVASVRMYMIGSLAHPCS